MVEPRGKTTRRAEASVYFLPCREARSSELPQTSAAGADDTPNRRTTKREYDRGRTFGRIPDDGTTRSTGTMDPNNGRKNDDHWKNEGGKTKLLRRGKQGTRNLFNRVSRGESSKGIILFQSMERRRGIVEPPFCRGTKAVFESNRNRVARSTIIDHPQADVNREKHRERVISSGLVLRWKETDAGYRAKARWCVHGFKDIHEIERSCPTPELSSINITLQILALTTRVRWPTVRKHSCKATRVSEMGLCMPLRFPKNCQVYQK